MGQPTLEGKKSEVELILAIAESMGGRALPDEISAECRKRGVWDDDQIGGLITRALRDRVTRALKTINPANQLPSYSPTKPGEWVQHSLLTEDEMEWVIVQRHGGVVSDYKVLARFHRDMILRYGWAPDISLTKDGWNDDAVLS